MSRTYKTINDRSKKVEGKRMIKLVRVDHRLIHGQVAFTWTKFLDVDCILVASDLLMKDELKMAGLRMAKPSNVKLVMKSIEDSAKALNSGVTDKYKLLILCESIEDVYRLANQTDCIQAINLGGTKSTEDRVGISKAVYVSEDDKNKIRELAEKNIKITVQMIPDDEEVDALKLIN